MVRVMLREGGSAPIPLAYRSWELWREERRRPPLPPAPLAPAGTSFCATCWGQGRILEPARNEEGLIPVLCPCCGGEGTVR